MNIHKKILIMIYISSQVYDLTKPVFTINSKHMNTIIHDMSSSSQVQSHIVGLKLWGHLSLTPDSKRVEN